MFSAPSAVSPEQTDVDQRDQSAQWIGGSNNRSVSEPQPAVVQLRWVGVDLDAVRLTGTEWAAYYDQLAAAFGLTIDPIGPNFGTEPLLDVIADSSALATFVGERTRLVWPADYDLRRIAVHDPTPVYPHSLIWCSDNAYQRSPHSATTSARHSPTTATPRAGHRNGLSAQHDRIAPAGVCVGQRRTGGRGTGVPRYSA
jgi:hypothetical protein